EFIDDSSFRLNSIPFPERDGEIPLGLYELPRRSGEAHLYRLNHPLAECLLARAKERELTPAEVHFDYGARAGKVSILQPLIGQSGWVTLTMMTVEALDQAEDYLIFAGFRDAGDAIDQEQAARLLQLPGTVATISELGLDVDKVECQRAATREVLLKTISERNSRFFEAELAKLDGWADDQVASSEKALKDTKKRSFFTESGFRPDFILWLLKDEHQTICFLDPKGLRNFTDNFNNPKIQLAGRIKELERNLKRTDIQLESFLISQTFRHQLRWPSPSDTTRDASPEDFSQHHILCAKDEPDTYVRTLLDDLTSQPVR